MERLVPAFPPSRLSLTLGGSGRRGLGLARAPGALGARAALGAQSSLSLAAVVAAARRPALGASPPRSAPIPAAVPERAYLSLRTQYPRCGTAAMATKIDKEACRTAYNLVRDDGSAVIW